MLERVNLKNCELYIDQILLGIKEYEGMLKSSQHYREENDLLLNFLEELLLYTVPKNINGYVPILINTLETIVREGKILSS